MLVQSQDAAGPTPRVATLLADELQRLGCSVVTHRWGGSKSGEGTLARVFRTLGDVRSVYRRTAGDSFDLALVHTAHDWRTAVRDIPLTRALRRRRLPVVLHLHGSQPERLHAPGNRGFRVATSLLLRSVDLLLVLSREEQERWMTFTSRVRVRAIRNPYAPHMSIVPRVDRRTDDHATVLFVGRLLREKGVFDLLGAMALVAERVPCRLVLVGEGPCAADVAARVRSLGLTDRVSLLGYLTGTELERAYADADVFVLPTYWPEGFPTVLAEAMEAGLPIVTTPIRGAADHLVDGEHVLFVEPKDVEGLAEALVTLLDDQGRRLRMGEANRRRLAEFEPSAVARDYLDVLDTVVASRRRPTDQRDS